MTKQVEKLTQLSNENKILAAEALLINHSKKLVNIENIQNIEVKLSYKKIS